jgi:hypothetical protein
VQAHEVTDHLLAFDNWGNSNMLKHIGENRNDDPIVRGTIRELIKLFLGGADLYNVPLQKCKPDVAGYPYDWVHIG